VFTVIHAVAIWIAVVPAFIGLAVLCLAIIILMIMIAIGLSGVVYQQRGSYQ